MCLEATSMLGRLGQSVRETNGARLRSNCTDGSPSLVVIIVPLGVKGEPGD